jgi:hypothetical protein
MSFTATNSISLSSIAVRTMFRPIRPKPLIPTLIGILPPEGRPTRKPKVAIRNVALMRGQARFAGKNAALQERATSPCELKSLWAAAAKVNAASILLVTAGVQARNPL